MYTWLGRHPWTDFGHWNGTQVIFGKMRGMCRDYRGTVYIADKTNADIIAYNPEGKRTRTFGKPILKRPAFVTCDRLGRVYVTDEDEGCVIVFDQHGSQIFKIGSKGTGNGELLGPSGICIDPKGNVVVADTLNNRICVFTPDGRFKHHLVTEDKLFQPVGLDINNEGLIAITTNHVTFKSISVYKLCT